MKSSQWKALVVVVVVVVVVAVVAHSSSFSIGLWTFGTSSPVNVSRTDQDDVNKNENGGNKIHFGVTVVMQSFTESLGAILRSNDFRRIRSRDPCHRRGEITPLITPQDGPMDGETRNYFHRNETELDFFFVTNCFLLITSWPLRAKTETVPNGVMTHQLRSHFLRWL